MNFYNYLSKINNDEMLKVTKLLLFQEEIHLIGGFSRASIGARSPMG